jgi:hypothetical protein
MHQGDDDNIRRKAYELWESEGRPEGRHDEHWRKAHQSFAQDKNTAEISGGSAGTMTPEAGDGTPDVSAADEPGDIGASTPSAPVSSAQVLETQDVDMQAMDTQGKAMIPENGAENLSRTAKPEPGSEPTPPAKRPRTQRKKTPAS